jgi:putative spermidine/putrescine transport system ATP-binding protein
VDVAIENLTVSLSGKPILHGVDLTVQAGQFLTLLGPSGSGKTTTLNVVAGFVERTGGHVRVGGTPIDAVPTHARNIGFLFQNYALFPHMTVGENIEFPLRARRIGSADRSRMVNYALELVRLGDMRARSVQSLSGGQQQRVALARALVFNPTLLLLDEPLAALDKQLREAMQLELKRIQVETGTTTIAVTHDQVEAMSMSDVIAIMRDGRVEQVGRPEDVYRRPGTLFVAVFLGEANLIDVTGGCVQGFGSIPSVSSQDGVAVIRPEDVVVCDPRASGSIEAEVLTAVYQGSRRRVTLRSAGINDPLVVSIPPNGPDLKVGDQVSVGLSENYVHVVAEEANAR